MLRKMIFLGIICSSLGISTDSLPVRTAVRFYNHTRRGYMVRMHCDAVLSSTGAPLIKIVKRNYRQSQIVVLYKPFELGFGRRIHVNQP